MGFRFLKNPSFFADSLYLKKPSRIMAMITIMVLSLLIYSIAQRQLRNALQKAKETIPNQIKKDHNTPTMKWVFQVLDGITVIYIKDRNSIKKFIHGINNVKKKIISHLGDVVMGVYGLSESMIC